MQDSMVSGREMWIMQGSLGGGEPASTYVCVCVCVSGCKDGKSREVGEHVSKSLFEKERTGKKGTRCCQQGPVRGMDHEDMLREPKWQIKTNMGKTRRQWEPRKSRKEAQGQREKQSLAEW